MSEHELQQQGPAFCSPVLCLWPLPHSSGGCLQSRHCAGSLLRKHLPSATTPWAAGTAHGHSKDTCSGSSGKTSTLPALYMYLSGRQESRKKVWTTGLLPKSDQSVE